MKKYDSNSEGKWKTVEYVGNLSYPAIKIYGEIFIKGKENLFQLERNSSNPSLSHRGSTVQGCH